ncbi:MAG: hypothetical protein Q4B09_06475 [Lachnospiraceae bacterium]|nr:hypothetical protein [Lachnospiraceae bacterium]
MRQVRQLLSYSRETDRSRIFGLLIADSLFMLPAGIVLVFFSIFRFAALFMGSAESLQYPRFLYDVSGVLLFLLGISYLLVVWTVLPGLSAWDARFKKKGMPPAVLLALSFAAGGLELLFVFVTDGNAALHLLYYAGELLLSAVYYYGRLWLDQQ